MLAVITADGTVLWVPHQIFRSSCSIDVLNFPFDYQVIKCLSKHPESNFHNVCKLSTNFPLIFKCINQCLMFQTCHMWFGSWTYSISDLDLQLAFDSGIDTSTFMSDYKDSCAWEIVNRYLYTQIIHVFFISPEIYFIISAHF